MFDALIAPLFRQDEQGRTIFFVWGVGRGRIVPTPQAEVWVRRYVQVVSICGVVGMMVLGFFRRDDRLMFLIPGYLAAAFVAIAALWLLTRTWPASEMRITLKERRSAAAVAAEIGTGYLVFGMLAGGVMTALGLFILISEGLSLAGLAVTVFFGAGLVFFVYLLCIRKQA